MMNKMHFLHAKCTKIQVKILWYRFQMFLIKTPIIAFIKVLINQWICFEESQHFRYFIKMKDLECLKDLYLEKLNINDLIKEVLN